MRAENKLQSRGKYSDGSEVYLKKDVIKRKNLIVARFPVTELPVRNSEIYPQLLVDIPNDNSGRNLCVWEFIFWTSSVGDLD